MSFLQQMRLDIGRQNDATDTFGGSSILRSLVVVKDDSSKTEGNSKGGDGSSSGATTTKRRKPLIDVERGPRRRVGGGDDADHTTDDNEDAVEFLIEAVPKTFQDSVHLTVGKAIVLLLSSTESEFDHAFHKVLARLGYGPRSMTSASIVSPSSLSSSGLSVPSLSSLSSHYDSSSPVAGPNLDENLFDVCLRHLLRDTSEETQDSTHSHHEDVLRSVLGQMSHSGNKQRAMCMFLCLVLHMSSSSTSSLLLRWINGVLSSYSSVDTLSSTKRRQRADGGSGGAAYTATDALSLVASLTSVVEFLLTSSPHGNGRDHLFLTDLVPFLLTLSHETTKGSSKQPQSPTLLAVKAADLIVMLMFHLACSAPLWLDNAQAAAQSSQPSPSPSKPSPPSLPQSGARIVLLDAGDTAPSKEMDTVEHTTLHRSPFPWSLFQDRCGDLLVLLRQYVKWFSPSRPVYACALVRVCEWIGDLTPANGDGDASLKTLRPDAADSLVCLCVLLLPDLPEARGISSLMRRRREEIVRRLEEPSSSSSPSPSPQPSSSSTPSSSASSSLSSALVDIELFLSLFCRNCDGATSSAGRLPPLTMRMPSLLSIDVALSKLSAKDVAAFQHDTDDRVVDRLRDALVTNLSNALPPLSSPRSSASSPSSSRRAPDALLARPNTDITVAVVSVLAHTLVRSSRRKVVWKKLLVSTRRSCQCIWDFLTEGDLVSSTLPSSLATFSRSLLDYMAFLGEEQQQHLPSDRRFPTLLSFASTIMLMPSSGGVLITEAFEILERLPRVDATSSAAIDRYHSLFDRISQKVMLLQRRQRQKAQHQQQSQRPNNRSKRRNHSQQRQRPHGDRATQSTSDMAPATRLFCSHLIATLMRSERMFKRCSAAVELLCSLRPPFCLPRMTYVLLRRSRGEEHAGSKEFMRMMDVYRHYLTCSVVSRSKDETTSCTSSADLLASFLDCLRYFPQQGTTLSETDDATAAPGDLAPTDLSRRGVWRGPFARRQASPESPSSGSPSSSSSTPPEPWFSSLVPVASRVLSRMSREEIRLFMPVLLRKIWACPTDSAMVRFISAASDSLSAHADLLLPLLVEYMTEQDAQLSATAHEGDATFHLLRPLLVLKVLSVAAYERDGDDDDSVMKELCALLFRRIALRYSSLDQSRKLSAYLLSLLPSRCWVDRVSTLLVDSCNQFAGGATEGTTDHGVSTDVGDDVAQVLPQNLLCPAGERVRLLLFVLCTSTNLQCASRASSDREMDPGSVDGGEKLFLHRLASRVMPSVLKMLRMAVETGVSEQLPLPPTQQHNRHRHHDTSQSSPSPPVVHVDAATAAELARITMACLDTVAFVTQYFFVLAHRLCPSADLGEVVSFAMIQCMPVAQASGGDGNDTTLPLRLRVLLLRAFNRVFDLALPLLSSPPPHNPSVGAMVRSAGLSLRGLVACFCEMFEAHKDQAGAVANVRESDDFALMCASLVEKMTVFVDMDDVVGQSTTSTTTAAAVTTTATSKATLRDILRHLHE